MSFDKFLIKQIYWKNNAHVTFLRDRLHGQYADMGGPWWSHWRKFVQRYRNHTMYSADNPWNEKEQRVFWNYSDRPQDFTMGTDFVEKIDR